MFDLHGKTVLITGSSRGIGRAALLAMAQQGACVIMHCSRPSAPAEETVAALDAMGADYRVVYQDLSKRGTADELYEQIRGMGLTVNVLVLNASIEHRLKLEEITDEEFDLHMDLNLRAPIMLLKRFVPDMKREHWGRIITVGSVQQVKPLEAMLVYAASKSALRNIALNMAVQLAPDGITVNNIAPGAIRTDRNKDALSDPAYEEHVRNLIPVRYIGQPKDIAALMVYLASDESKYMTGQDLMIDGGKGL